MQDLILFILAATFFFVYFTIAYHASKRTGTNIFKIAFLLGVRPESPLTKNEKMIVVIMAVLIMLTFALADLKLF